MQLHEETIFNEALDIVDPERRAKFLESACAGNAKLREEIVQLLDAYEQGSAIEPTCPGSPWTEKEPRGPREQVGDHVGRYKLLEKLGEGGMGVVYMAEQTKPVRRKVALKIIKVGMDTGQVVARFEAERQALALMNHPNIAKVLDAGESETGRPYFAMELVRGIPITEFCDQQKLDLRERLKLFVDVCDAVQHAHQKGIIHRDIKPSNVLVELHDVKAVPKIIDFGIAKATNQQLTERTLFTQFSQMIGTPIYMSPEQAQLSGLDVDTRSDIYSLGVLLYELLTGTTPVTRETLREAGFEEMRRMIREDDVPRPSARVSTLKAETLSTLAANQRLAQDRIQTQLRGDLDWIVVKSLEKDRTRRYQTSSDFAEDIQRYLDDEPVEAHPPSIGYQARKVIRRYKVPFAVASVTMMLLIAATLISLRYAEVANREREIADAERKAAQNNFRLAQNAVDRYLVAVSEEEILEEPRLKPLRSRLLEDALKYYQRFVADHADDDSLKAELARAHSRIADVLKDLEHLEDALAQQTQALAIAQELYDANPGNSKRTYQLAEAHHLCAGIYKLQGRNGDARRSSEIAVSLMQEQVAMFPDSDEALHFLGQCQYRLVSRAEMTDEEASKHIRAALSNLEKVSNDYEDREGCIIDMAKCEEGLGVLAADSKSRKRHYERAIALVGPLLKEVPGSLRVRQFHTHLSLNELLVNFGNQSQSKLITEICANIKIWTQLIVEDPHSPDYVGILHAIETLSRKLAFELRTEGDQYVTEDFRNVVLALEEPIENLESVAKTTDSWNAAVVELNLLSAAFIKRLDPDDRKGIATTSGERIDAAIASLPAVLDSNATGFYLTTLRYLYQDCIAFGASIEEQEIAERLDKHLKAAMDVARRGVSRNRADRNLWKAWGVFAYGHFRSQNWNGVEVEVQRAVELGFEEPRYLIEIAPLLLLGGKHAQYAELCESLVEQWSVYQDDLDCSNVLAFCSMNRLPMDYGPSLKRIADRALRNPQAWTLGVHNHVLFRTGRLDLPIQWVYTSESSIHRPVAYQLAGEFEKARTSFEKSQVPRPFEWDFHWSEQLDFEVFRQEAEQRIVHGMIPVAEGWMRSDDLQEAMTAVEPERDVSTSGTRYQVTEGALELAREWIRGIPPDSFTWGHWERWGRLCFEYYQGRDWEGADVDARITIQLQPDMSGLVNIAPLLLLAGRHDEYHALCERLIDQWDEVTDPKDRVWVMAICTLDRLPTENGERLIEMAELTEQSHVYGKGMLWRANIRLGRYSQVAEANSQGFVEESWHKTWPPYQTAIALHTLGKQPEAEAWLTESERAYHIYLQQEDPVSRRMQIEAYRQEAIKRVREKMIPAADGWRKAENAGAP